jgi:hypothetical protein
MTRSNGLLFDPLGAVVLAAGIVGLAAMVPGYNSVFQTVSQIGEGGSGPSWDRQSRLAGQD